MAHLTKQQESFCENAGLFGVMIAVACLIQHMIFMIPGWVTFSVIGIYILCITGFALLMKKSVIALRLLFISVILIFLLEVFMILSLAFSLVLLLLLIYLLIVVVVLYMGETQKQLRQKTIAEKEEATKWNGIV
jgi:predicted membrane protein